MGEEVLRLTVSMEPVDETHSQMLAHVETTADPLTIIAATLAAMNQLGTIASHPALMEALNAAQRQQPSAEGEAPVPVKVLN